MNVPLVATIIVGLFVILGIWTAIEGFVADRRRMKKAQGRQEMLDAVRRNRGI
jgi:preprotein translocase subunit YajC